MFLILNHLSIGIFRIQFKLKNDVAKPAIYKLNIMKKILLIIIAISCTILQAQKFEELAKTPPMGWNSWNTFGDKIHEDLVKETADIFIEAGLKDAGYEYIVLDDGWMAKERDSLGNLVPHPEKFPNGIKAVVDYVHSKGLKFGLYNCAGSKTCGGYPGSRGYEYQDAKLYASWGVDYLKYDWCNTEKLCAEGAYMTMRDAVYEAGRPVILSICEWGNNEPWLWGKEMGHLWRTTGDITNCWDCEVDHGTWSSWGIMKIVYMRDLDIRKYAGPGHWNDPDMMEVGNGMTVSEDRAHFTLWCMLAAPLMMGNDLRIASEETLEILTNKEVIAINQDPLGIQAFRYSSNDSIEVWVKPLVKNDWAICFLNRKSISQSIEFDWNEHKILDDIFNKSMDFKREEFKLRDVYMKKDIGTTKKPLKGNIDSHDVLLIRLTKEE